MRDLVLSEPMQLPQNLKALLQEIGESTVLLKLCMHLHGNEDWRVYRNYAEAGCDIVLVGNRRINIEVKTRQSTISKRPDRRSMHFTISEGERNSAEFFVCYWFDRGDIFVVPRDALSPIRSGNKTVFKFIPYFSSKLKRYTDNSNQYLEAWSLILDSLKE